jgi:hypothetical protein
MLAYTQPSPNVDVLLLLVQYTVTGSVSRMLIGLLKSEVVIGLVHCFQIGLEAFCKDGIYVDYVFHSPLNWARSY